MNATFSHVDETRTDRLASPHCKRVDVYRRFDVPFGVRKPSARATVETPGQNTYGMALHLTSPL
jgi:hypothetical protein